MITVKYQDWTYAYAIFSKGILRLNMENRISIQIFVEWMNAYYIPALFEFMYIYTYIYTPVKCNIIKVNINTNMNTTFHGRE